MEKYISSLDKIFESVWNLYFLNNGQVNYALITITLAVIFGLITLSWYFINSRRKLKIKTSYTAAFEQNMITGVLGPNIPLFSVYITNTSRRNIYINTPLIRLSKPFNNQYEFQIINTNNPIAFPRCINSLEKFQYDFNMASLNTQLFQNVNNLKSFKVTVTDSLNKKFKSKPVKVSDFLNYFNTIQN